MNDKLYDESGFDIIELDFDVSAFKTRKVIEQIKRLII